MNARLRQARKLLRVLPHRSWWRGLRYGVAPTVEHQALPLDADYRSIIDVGANKGQFALFARARFPAAELHCFEPLAEPFAVCSRLFRADSAAHLYQFAAGARDEVREIHIARRADSSSLLGISARQTSRFPGTEEAGRQLVEVRSLDHVSALSRLPRPTLLKVDVQGFELEVFRGAQRLLSEAIDTVLVECSFVDFYDGQPLFDQVYCFLRRSGYALRAGRISAAASDGSWEQGDFVFQRQS
jgi:FkbM family methyltransferase